MRLAFMGTPDFSSAALGELHQAGHEVACVYTQPPRARGRGQKPQPTPVGGYAEAHGLPLRTPASLRDPAEAAFLQALQVDAVIVVAFGQILPEAVLQASRLGAFNLHASLLPRWRGAAPIQRAIMAGDAVTGVQVMRMTAGLDEGAVLASRSVEIAPDDTYATLERKLRFAGAHLLNRTVPRLGAIPEVPQAGQPTYAKKITPAEARIDWTRPAVELDRRVRGLSPFPGAWFEAPERFGGAPVRVKALLSQPTVGVGAPGEVLEAAPGELVVAAGEGAVRLLRLQREGKGAQDAADFLRGSPLPPGTRLA